MKKYFKYSAPLAILLTLVSCQDVVQVKLDDGAKLYVIDAFINDLRADQKVRVVSNSNYFSASEPDAITNASVVLKDLNTGKSYNFSYTSNGYYVYPITAADTISKANHQYQLDVTIDGAVYTSVVTQKRPAIMDTIVAQKNGNGGFGPPTKDTTTTYSCILSAYDIVDPNTDYYWIKTYRNDTLFNAPGDINICIDGTGGPIPSADRNLLEFSEPAILLGFKAYRANSTCKVEIHSVTRETYFFFTQAFNQINNAGLFATTPENVKTNFTMPKDAKTKVVGWFSMSSVVAKKITVK